MKIFGVRRSHLFSLALLAVLSLTFVLPPSINRISAIASVAARPAPATIPVVDVAGLINAINTANNESTNPGPDTIELATGGTYILDAADNFEFGPNGLPPITSQITINGNGATIQRNGAAPKFRLFYISGGLSGLSAGNLTLKNLTLRGGLARGGDGGMLGGGGAGMGGAVFNHGTLALDRVTLTANTAQGGTNSAIFSYAGGGIGGDAIDNSGGGFGGSPLGSGGIGGSASSRNGGGGGGFRASDNGAPASSITAGNGGGNGLLGGAGGDGGGTKGDGGGGGNRGDVGGGGGNFGFGGVSGGGGGGVGGGGGGGGGLGLGPSFGGAGGGGFGGGGGNFGGFGGFGGGGGNGGGGGGFAGGSSSPDGGGGGGGGGLGGAIFDHLGTLTLTNCTLTANTAHGGSGGSTGGNGGNGGSGFGGGIFNLNGLVSLTNCTVAGNTVVAGAGGTGTIGNGSPGSADGGALYNLAFGNQIEDGLASTATITLINTIIADSTGGDDLVNDKRDMTTTPAIGTNTNTATVELANHNIIETQEAKSGTTLGAPLSTADPMLGALMNNGGTTETMAITTASPAYNQGNSDDVINPDDSDQRGVGFPRISGGAVDIGAFEVQLPEVTINQAAGQFDPTTATPINFTAVFSEPVNGFAGDDVVLGGTAGATTAIVTQIAPLDGTTYNVAVSGMAECIGAATVTASIPAGAATGGSGNASTASTGIDNTVTWENFCVECLRNDPPPMSCPGDTTVEATSSSGAVVNYTAPSCLECNCDRATPTQTAGLPSGATFPVGTTVNTYQVSDGGQTNTCSFSVTVRTPAAKCPLGQGYWKNNVNSWPVTSLSLGSQAYTKTQLLTILNTATGSGGSADASVILADQLIAARLSIANGSDSAPVSAAIAAADALLGTFSGGLPYKVKSSSAIGKQMTTLAALLDQYNKALLTPGCTP